MLALILAMQVLAGQAARDSLLVGVGIAIPLMFLFAHVKFMGTYAAYYKVKEIMIDPLQNEETEEACPHCSGKGKIIKNPCAKCRGLGRIRVQKTVNIDVPAGIADGQTLRLGGQGDCGEGMPLHRVGQRRLVRAGSDAAA